MGLNEALEYGSQSRGARDGTGRRSTLLQSPPAFFFDSPPEPEQLALPESVGQYFIFNYLSIGDICRCRAVSTQLRSWAEFSLSQLVEIKLEKEENLRDEDLNHVLSKCVRHDVHTMCLEDCPSVELKSVNVNVMKSLRRFLVLNCPSVSSRAFQGALASCNCLEEIDVSEVMSDTALQSLRCVRIVRLKNCAGVTNDGLLALSANCGHTIQELRLERCDSITDQGLCAFAQNTTRIKSLQISHCTKVSCNGVAQTLQYFDGLEELHVGAGIRCSSKLLIEMSRRLLGGTLRVLYLHDCSGFKSNEGLLALSSTFSASKVLQNLHRLALRELDNVTAGALCSVLRGCERLEEIDLSGSRGVDSTVLACIAGHCGGSRLTRVAFRGCDQITDADIKTLVLHCPNIEYMDLSRCSKISNVALVSISRVCRNLKVLSLFCCSRINDDGISFLAESCAAKQLAALDVSWCLEVTSSGLIDIARFCPKLSCLVLEGCEHISDLEVSNLVHTSKRLMASDVHRISTKSVDMRAFLSRPRTTLLCRTQSAPLGIGAKDSSVGRQRRPKQRSNKKRIDTSLLGFMMAHSPRQEHHLHGSDLGSPSVQLSHSLDSTRFISLDQLEKLSLESSRRRWGEDRRDLARLRAFSYSSSDG